MHKVVQQEAELGTTSSKRPIWNNRRRNAKWWEYFSEGADLQGSPVVICSLCETSLDHPEPKNLGTSNMKRHLTTGNCKQKGKRMREDNGVLDEHFKKVKRAIPDPVSPFTDTSFQQAILRFIVHSRLPFRTIEHEAFRDMLKLCRPSVNIPGRTHLAKLIEKHSSEVKERLMDDLPEKRKVSIALDCWTSPNGLGIMAVLCYYVTDDWKLVEKLISFETLAGKHSGKSMANIVVQALKKYGLTGRLAATADNAHPNNTLRRSLRIELDRLGVTWSSDRGTIRCLAHVVQLCVTSFLNALNASDIETSRDAEGVKKRLASIKSNAISFQNTFSKVRAISILLSLEASPASPGQQSKTLLQTSNPDPGGQNSGSVFNMLKKEYATLMMAEEEWKMVDILLNVLQPFNDVTTAISTSLEPSIHEVFRLYSWIFDEIEKSRDLFLKEPLDPRPRTIYNLGTILDPLKKTEKSYKIGTWSRRQKRDYVKDFISMYYQENYQTAEETEHLKQVPAITSVVAASGIASIGREPAEQQRLEVPVGSEAKRYTSTPVVKVKDSYNPLVLWKDLEKEFPTLAEMAKDILPIPAAGVGIERRFSEGRDIVTYRRSHLSSATIENLMMIRHHEKVSVAPTQRIRPATEADHAEFRDEADDNGGDEDSDASDSDVGDIVEPMAWEGLDDSDDEEFLDPLEWEFE
ncbi:hypothetical protein Egran_02811 [Elaphomyces granulatus]|uniref:BED-type domain-containing protein n=1 Tax=Elaphomyces granulatus TaxID=519963 RepID=A0A232LZ94_9EURO|nr:hypothetical protein Egran_02811 [Elaphomyces granulatus]